LHWGPDATRSGAAHQTNASAQEQQDLKMNTKIKKLLEQGEVDGVFAYKTIHGIPYPTYFTQENMNELESWHPFKARYPIVKMLLAHARQNPQKRFGILVRGCEERALNELYKWNQLDRNRVVVIGQACQAELAHYCECPLPYPTTIDYGEAPAPVTASQRVTELDQKPDSERLAWWTQHLNRCVKCYGCRDVCPVCFCTVCSLEQKEVVPTGKLPPDTSFHLVRAVHMAGRCIDCGLCEEVCPADIPLRALYKKVNSLVENIFHYQTGRPEDRSPFSFLGEESFLPPGPR